MQKVFTRCLLPSLALALTLGCVAQTPPPKYAENTAVALVFAVDDDTNQSTRAAPPPFAERLTAALNVRNLATVEVPFATYGGDFGLVRDTERRLGVMGRAAPGSDLLVLAEVRADFYSQLSGRYRWTVSVKLSVAQADTPQNAMVETFTIPAVLTYAHEGEDDALALVADEVARRLGSLVDKFMRGRVAAVTTSAATPAAPGERAPSIYFVLVDRFANGDPSNDFAVDTQDPSAWHGGDLRGLIDHIDYLADLGVRTLWLSPIFRTRYEPFMGHGAFHGYWVWDLHEIDPRFGTLADLHELQAALSARGMTMLLDLVVNHVGYQAPLLNEKPHWFHPHGTIVDWDDPVQVVTHEVHGLPDLDQSHPEVYAYLLQGALHWLDSVGIEGYRIDAVKHVSLDFWRRYNRELLDQHPAIVLLGELYDGSPQVVNDVQKVGNFTHMFDFPLAFALRDVYCQQQSVGHIAAVLGNDRFYADPLSLVTFVDNHDMPRIMTACGSQTKRVQNALTALFTLRGTPCLNYGTEAALEGEHEPENRGQMVFLAASTLKNHLTTLLGLRTQHPVLVHGTSEVVHFDPDLLVVRRRHAGASILLIIYNGAARRDLALADLVPGTWRDLLAGASQITELSLNQGDTFVLHSSDAAVPPPLAATQQWRIEVDVAELPATAQVFVVGSAPELGAWNPNLALGPLQRLGDRAHLEVDLPTGVVFAYKLIVRHADGAVHWEPGDNRYLFVEGSGEPLRSDLSLRR